MRGRAGGGRRYRARLRRHLCRKPHLVGCLPRCRPAADFRLGAWAQRLCRGLLRRRTVAARCLSRFAANRRKLRERRRARAGGRDDRRGTGTHGARRDVGAHAQPARDDDDLRCADTAHIPVPVRCGTRATTHPSIRGDFAAPPGRPHRRSARRGCRTVPPRRAAPAAGAVGRIDATGEHRAGRAGLPDRPARLQRSPNAWPALAGPDRPVGHSPL